MQQTNHAWEEAALNPKNTVMQTFIPHTHTHTHTHTQYIILNNPLYAQISVAHEEQTCQG